VVIHGWGVYCGKNEYFKWFAKAREERDRKIEEDKKRWLEEPELKEGDI
jgi:hypothetical protein